MKNIVGLKLSGKLSSENIAGLNQSLGTNERVKRPPENIVRVKWHLENIAA